METSLISVTLLLAFVVFVNANPHHRLPPSRQAALDACLKKLDLTEEKLHELRESDGSSEDDNGLGCFTACMDKELGLMNAEGNYDKESTLKNLPPHLPQEIRATMVDTCLEQKGTDECGTAKLYHACLKKSIFHRQMSPELMKLHDECRAELNITNEKIEKPMHPSEEMKTDCLGGCLIKRLGFLNQDGTINKDLFIERTPPHLKDAVQKFIDDCGGEVGADDCETAALINNCFRNSYLLLTDFISPKRRE